jgi:hypothetical protein
MNLNVSFERDPYLRMIGFGRPLNRGGSILNLVLISFDLCISATGRRLNDPCAKRSSNSFPSSVTHFGGINFAEQSGATPFSGLWAALTVGGYSPEEHLIAGGDC